MKTAVGVILAAVLAAGAGILGAVLTLKAEVATADSAAATPHDTGAPADYPAP